MKICIIHKSTSEQGPSIGCEFGTLFPIYKINK